MTRLIIFISLLSAPRVLPHELAAGATAGLCRGRCPSPVHAVPVVVLVVVLLVVVVVSLVVLVGINAAAAGVVQVSANVGIVWQVAEQKTASRNRGNLYVYGQMKDFIIVSNYLISNYLVLLILLSEGL